MRIGVIRRRRLRIIGQWDFRCLMFWFRTILIDIATMGNQHGWMVANFNQCSDYKVYIIWMEYKTPWFT